MHRYVKRMGIGVGLLLLVAIAVAVTGKVLGERKRARVVSVAVQPVAWATDPAALERGNYLFRSRGCSECHGKDGGGREFIHNANGMRVSGPNITSGGATAKYSAEDWVRIVRHGVRPNGRPAMIMPSEDYARFTDADIAAIVGYVRTLPPAQGGETVMELPLPVLALYGFGAIQDAYEKIDHSAAPAQPVAAAINVQHGAYVANMCIGCHGDGLSGGKIPGGPPDWPPAANITPGSDSALPRYPDANSFVAMLRSGKRPDGSAIKVMPFESLRELNDIDAQALYAYLKTVPAKAAGQR